MGQRIHSETIIGLFLALALLFGVVGEAKAQEPTEPAESECQSCHDDVHDEWSASLHGQATGRAFLQAWKKEGSSPECLACHTTDYDLASGTWETDGITCESCHEPDGVDHPREIMPTHGGPDDCGSCHVETHDEWEISEHGEQSLACVNCHNPHNTGLKTDGSQELCKTCHNEESHFYNDTAHAEEGLLCTDCHLRVSDEPVDGGHSPRRHTFTVDLKSCTQCHGAEMHYPVQNAMGETESAAAPVDVAASPEAQEEDQITPTTAALTDAAPQQQHPAGYVVAAIVGLGLGLVVAPGIEHLYRRSRGEQ
ncbi:MAG: multiheme c-type cytochrome [Chloroflexota bacterium]